MNNLLKSYKITLTDNTKSEDTIEENKEYTYYLNNEKWGWLDDVKQWFNDL